MKVAPDEPTEPAESPRDIELERQKQVQEKVAALVSACTQSAMSEVLLDRVRSDRDSSPEVVSDAARSFRQSRAAVDEALANMLALQVKLLKEVG